MENQLAKVQSATSVARFKQRPLYVFGPCSAEDRDQVASTALAISAHYPDAIFRSGVWKPRTRPGTFEGIGEIGLDWLKEAGIQSGLAVATEVANARHVELCLKKEIDVLWLGARTTVNPFYVQEIAEALSGVKIPVMIKNPVVPDLNLWIGAIERMEKSGITEIIAIHRGFHHFDSKPYRNIPLWEIPIELMAGRPDVPIICDVSHICGNPDLFPSVSQKAMDLNMAGLHIEAHPNPKEALSDAFQQITVEALKKLLDQIEYRKVSTDNPDFIRTLNELRNEIDQVDADLLSAVFRRMKLVRAIGRLKKENRVTILQVQRWKKIMNKYLLEGKKLGLSEHFLKGMLKNLHDESMRNQNDIMNR